MYRLNQVKLNIYHSDYDFKSKIAKLVKVSVDDIEWSTLIILHKSIDARDKKNILFVYNVAIDFVGVDIIRPLERYEPVSFNPIVGDDILPSHAETRDLTPKTVGADIIRPHIRPIVVGFGPAGIFASYIFALNGLKPIIIERGKSLDDRTKDVDKFFKTMELDEESNVCFGEGGAGAFSDGKLNTNNKDKTGIYHFVLETFVKFGADEKILYENMPHIGTDKLVDVIKNMRDEILRLGGEIHYNTKWTYEVGSQCLPLRDDLNKQSAGGWYPPLRDELNKQGTTQDDALKMIEFQEMIERRAFELEKGFIPYVTSGGRDICPEEVFKGKAKYSEKLREVFEGIGLSFNINEDIEKALQHFNKIISGFFSAGSQCSPLQDESPHYIIAGVETRTSSPVKLDRDENYMCNVPNYYPCGEGLGHGGGIMSCAVDGINTALKVIKNKCV